MIDTRLALALEEGGLVLPEAGRIAVIRPPKEARLACLQKDRINIIERLKPLCDQWDSLGFHCQVMPDETYCAVVLSVPRAKAEVRAMIAQAAAMTDGPVIVDGQKTDGIDSLLKEMRKRTTVLSPLSKAHGKLFVCPSLQPDAFEDWQAGPARTPGGFWTAPGVFSADGIDPASALLAETLPEKLGLQIGDFGAGWGFLSAHVLTRSDVEAIHLVEADHMALECARRNVGDPRAFFHWADVSGWQAPGSLDAVIMNPPFHTTRAADPALGQSFVTAAAAALSPQGQLWMVANRHLPYETTLQVAFTKVFEVAGDARFKVFHATRPKRLSRR